jgi:6-phosphogluconolactonase/glucosamine-6-phosphate isomerase/deaminase
VLVYLVDERYINRQHNDSNTKMIQESFVTPSGLPSANYIVPNTDLPLVCSLLSNDVLSTILIVICLSTQHDCLRDYENQLKSMLAKSKDGRVHVATLGLGDDGHFASLFPDLPEERKEAALDSNRYVD